MIWSETGNFLWGPAAFLEPGVHRGGGPVAPVPPMSADVRVRQGAIVTLVASCKLRRIYCLVLVTGWPHSNAAVCTLNWTGTTSVAHAHFASLALVGKWAGHAESLPGMRHSKP